MLTAVCFDLMDTVLHDPYLEAIEAATGLGLRDVARIKDPDSWPDFEVGRIDEGEFVRRFFTAAEDGRRFDIEAFHRVRRDGYAFLPGMEELLDDLAGHATRYVASNYPIWIEELASRFDFARRFDGVYASCHLGVRKPDPAFFTDLLQAIDTPAQQCLFVDDRAVNCEAAAAAGMQVHLFRGAGGLRGHLQAAGLLP